MGFRDRIFFITNGNYFSTDPLPCDPYMGLTSLFRMAERTIDECSIVAIKGPVKYQILILHAKNDNIRVLEPDENGLFIFSAELWKELLSYPSNYKKYNMVLCVDKKGLDSLWHSDDSRHLRERFEILCSTNIPWGGYEAVTSFSPELAGYPAKFTSEFHGMKFDHTKDIECAYTVN